MKQREITMGSLTAGEIQSRLETVLSIMKDSVHKPLKEPVCSSEAFSAATGEESLLTCFAAGQCLRIDAPR